MDTDDDALVLAAVLRLAAAWRTGGTPDAVLTALGRELTSIVGVPEVRFHAPGEGGALHSSRLVAGGLGGLDPVSSEPAPGEVVEMLDAGGEPDRPEPPPRILAGSAILPVYSGPTISHVLEIPGAVGHGPPGPEQVRLARALVTPATAALSVLDAQAAARVDVLTGLLNRRALMDRLDEEIAQAGRTGAPLCCLLADLDGFKGINDGWGHLVGDEVLRLVSDALTGETRPYDHLARYGGDEFVLVVPMVDEAGGRLVADRVHAAVRSLQPVVAGMLGAEVVGLSCSVGLALWRAGEDSDRLIDRADEALRRSKARGRDATTGEFAARRFGKPGSPPSSEASALGRLLAGRGLRTSFQPIIDLGTDTVVGFEALIRGPAGTSLERPERILAAARAEDRLVETDSALHLVALDQAARAGLRTPSTLFVNCEPETAGRLGELGLIWTRNGAPFESVVEISERMLAERPGSLLAAINELRAGGWGIALDGVGADERALALLPFVRPDVVKLNLRVLGARPGARLGQVAAAVHAYAEESGAAVLAQGVETEDELMLAFALGATLGQGYLFGRPAALPEHVPPARVRLPNLPAPVAAWQGSLFALASAQRPARRAPQALLDSIANHLLAQAAAVGPGAVVLAQIDDRDPLAGSRLEALAAVAGSVGFVGAVGPGITDHPAPGVHGGRTPPGDAVEWTLAAFGSTHASALVARDSGGPSRGRQFEFVLTHDRPLVLELARAVMARVAPAD